MEPDTDRARFDGNAGLRETSLLKRVVEEASGLAVRSVERPALLREIRDGQAFPLCQHVVRGCAHYQLVLEQQLLSGPFIRDCRNAIDDEVEFALAQTRHHHVVMRDDEFE